MTCTDFHYIFCSLEISMFNAFTLKPIVCNLFFCNETIKSLEKTKYRDFFLLIYSDGHILHGTTYKKIVLFTQRRVRRKELWQIRSTVESQSKFFGTLLIRDLIFALEFLRSETSLLDVPRNMSVQNGNFLCHLTTQTLRLAQKQF